MKLSINCFILILVLSTLCSHPITPTTGSLEQRTNVTNGLELKSSTSDYSNNTSTTEHHNREPIVKSHLKKSCFCLNGGTCISRYVCLCPSQFRGRRCEMTVENRPCGTRQHGDVYRDHNCGLCHCFDGAEICDDEMTCEDSSDLMGLVDSPDIDSGSKNCTSVPNLILLVAYFVAIIYIFHY